MIVTNWKRLKMEKFEGNKIVPFEKDNQVSLLKSQVMTARNELRNLRKEVRSLRCLHEKEVGKVKSFVSQLMQSQEGEIKSRELQNLPVDVPKTETASLLHNTEMRNYSFCSVGEVKSMFKTKNGIPRQPGVCDSSRATLTIEKTVFNNPEHSLEGLQDFSHIWIMFVFHKNNNTCAKAKIRPPRLNGKKVGVFSTRSPYRPNPIGLSLVKLDRISGNTLHLSGVDLLDGTPVLDIKPYIPGYDSTGSAFHPNTDSLRTDVQSLCCDDTLQELDVMKSDKTETQTLLEDGPEAEVASVPQLGLYESLGDSQCLKSLSEPAETSVTRITEEIYQQTSDCTGINSQDSGNVEIAGWITDPPIPKLSVRFTSTAMEQLKLFDKCESKPCSDKDIDRYKLEYTDSAEELQNSIVKILQNDPRSVYRRKKCADRLYYFSVDTAHITCWFDDVQKVAEVVKIEPISLHHEQSDQFS